MRTKHRRTMFARSLALHGLLLLALVLSLLPQPAPGNAAPLAAPGQSAFGVNSHLGSRHGDSAVVDEAIDLLATSDAGWIREEFQWGLIDPNRSGDYLPGRWDLIDQVIAEETARGFNIIGLLNDAPGFAPPDMAGFKRFVRDVVQRYPQITYWEVWNEPENALYWNNPDPAAYAALLREVSQVIRAENPNARIISAGIVPTHADFIRGMYEHGAWDSFDILGLHPYVDPYTPETGQIGDGGDVSKIQSLVNQFGSKPIWATEYGWSTGHADRLAGGGDPVTPEQQANYLVRGAALLRAAGVERVLWYKYKDENEDRTNAYGLIAHGAGRTDFSSPKPAYDAFTTLNQQIGMAAPVMTLNAGQASPVLDFEQSLTWAAGPDMGSLTHSNAQAYTGRAAGMLSYRFDNSGGGGNDWVGLRPPEEIPIAGQPTRMGIWVYGDGSGHELKVWLRDANNEVLQYRLGIVGSGGWRFISTPINGPVEEWNQMRDFGTPGNGQLDYPASFVAFVYDDNPNSETGSGSIYIDDLTALSSGRGVRFDAGGGEFVDVLWALENQSVRIPTDGSSGTLVDRSGQERSITPSDGAFTLTLTESPVYLRHAGGEAPGESATQPDEGSTGDPVDDPGDPGDPVDDPGDPGDPVDDPIAPDTGCAPEPDVVGTSSPAGTCRFFPETGYEVCGRLLDYWQQNDGLRVFGYPITPQRQERIEGQVYDVQWFQRNRLELHPANSAPYDVLLGRLGAEQMNCASTSSAEPRAPTGSCYRLPNADYDVCEPFLSAWRANGLELDGRPGFTESESLALFGLPIGPPRTEVLEGETYTVQWFERARFEWHPENNPPYNVLYGLLGNEIEP